MTGLAPRTINNHLDFLINALHFVTHFSGDFLYFITHTLNFTVYYLDLVVDAVCDPQNLRMCHPSLFLRQSVELLESVLQISQSGQFPQELFCVRSSEGSYTADWKLTC
jgi:hypothetical protein